jgi:hypothetical protein
VFHHGKYTLINESVVLVRHYRFLTVYNVSCAGTAVVKAPERPDVLDAALLHPAPPQLLTEMAGFDGNTGVIVLAVTKLSVSARAGHMRVIRELHLREPPQDPRVLC